MITFYNKCYLQAYKFPCDHFCDGVYVMFTADALSMPGARCTVAVCNNSYAKTNRLPPGQKVVYHSFPNDGARRQQWVQLCRRAGKWNPDSCTVCSIHFTPEDYARDLKAELLNIPSKKVRH